MIPRGELSRRLVISSVTQLSWKGDVSLECDMNEIRNATHVCSCACPFIFSILRYSSLFEPISLNASVRLPV